MELTVKFISFPYLLQKTSDTGIRIVGICPGQRLKIVLLIDKRQVGVDPFPYVDSVGEIFPGCQDETLEQHVSGVNIHLAPAPL